MYYVNLGVLILVGVLVGFLLTQVTIWFPKIRMKFSNLGHDLFSQIMT